MIVTFISQCEHKAINRTSEVLDAFANRIGSRTWQTVITEKGLQAVKRSLSKTATKNTAVSCHWIRSRSRSDFLWVVGRKNKFNSQGFVPVNYTSQDSNISLNENDWQFLPLIESLTVFAALLHDFGKLTTLFQDKLKNKNKNQSDPLRHEWISLLFLIAIVDNKSDDEWLSNIIDDKIHEKITQLKIENIEYPLADLPPVASMVAWLILSHHKLPSREGDKGKEIILAGLFQTISSTWGYENTNNKQDFIDWFRYEELPSQSIDWQQHVKFYAIQLKNNLPQAEEVFKSLLFRPIMTYARLCLMLGDHYYSSLPKDRDWYSSSKLFANTDEGNKLKQQLDEHLVGVAKQAKINTQKLPQLEAIFNQNIRVIDNKNISKKSPQNYKWQDNAVQKIKKWKRNEIALDKHQFGFFAVNMASTGKGKTFANAKVMQALSANENSLRYVLALGLRTLTLQTGREYRDKIKLKNDELAVLIGSKTIIDLDKQKNQHGSESRESLLENEIISNGSLPEQGLDTILKSKKDRQFLYAPVLACTIDHIIQATEVTRGGKYILPTLRLMSSDLVIDEIDDFDNEDLIAIGRLIHLAGMLGRKVMISSATIPPDLAEGYFNAYQNGWNIFATMRKKNKSIGCAWIDEFKTKVCTIKDRQRYQKEHAKFIDKRIANLEQEPVRRKANIAQCSTDAGKYFEAIRDAILEKHKHHCIVDSKTGKNISIGVVRVANIDPCVALTKFLLKSENSAENIEIKSMAYHSRQVLLMRHEQEKYLDHILKRNENDSSLLEDKVIRYHLDHSSSADIIFVLVATPVEEVGRDHDFDWAVIEPSSFRSFIQLAGRVLRHREKEVIEPNIAIMEYNYRALKTGGHKVAFKWPGYQKEMDDLKSYNLNKLVNIQELATKLDATNRIKKTESSELANLEHKVIQQLLTNYELKGPESMQGWLDGDCWLTALSQKYVRFRGNKSQDMTVYLTTENTFLEKGEKGVITTVARDSVTFYKLSKEEYHNLWLKRDYKLLISDQIRNSNDERARMELIYGELNLPTYGKPLKPDQFVYNEQLGLSKKQGDTIC